MGLVTPKQVKVPLIMGDPFDKPLPHKYLAHALIDFYVNIESTGGFY